MTLWGPDGRPQPKTSSMLVGAIVRGTMLCAAAVGYALM